mmetsp:Transcript_8583/g.12655  ORF Transcript_8583/g.12655 Transcript_8583/m.12655 type:complete len:523 (+) Transcript_8583:3280-4848(+)
MKRKRCHSFVTVKARPQQIQADMGVSESPPKRPCLSSDHHDGLKELRQLWNSRRSRLIEAVNSLSDDVWAIICSFLSFREIYGIVPLLSQYHNQFIKTDEYLFIINSKCYHMDFSAVHTLLKRNHPHLDAIVESNQVDQNRPYSFYEFKDSFCSLKEQCGYASMVDMSLRPLLVSLNTNQGFSLEIPQGQQVRSLHWVAKSKETSLTTDLPLQLYLSTFSGNIYLYKKTTPHVIYQHKPGTTLLAVQRWDDACVLNPIHRLEKPENYVSVYIKIPLKGKRFMLVVKQPSVDEVMMTAASVDLCLVLTHLNLVLIRSTSSLGMFNASTGESLSFEIDVILSKVDVLHFHCEGRLLYLVVDSKHILVCFVDTHRVQLLQRIHVPLLDLDHFRWFIRNGIIYFLERPAGSHRLMAYNLVKKQGRCVLSLSNEGHIDSLTFIPLSGLFIVLTKTTDKMIQMLCFDAHFDPLWHRSFDALVRLHVIGRFLHAPSLQKVFHPTYSQLRVYRASIPYTIIKEDALFLFS